MNTKQFTEKMRALIAKQKGDLIKKFETLITEVKADN